jgi:hypothetical protein
MKLGNIVSNSTLNISNDFNVVKNIDDIMPGIPTLIVGWDYIKKKYPDYDIIDRKLDDNLYWTFKKTEKRDFHEEDIYNFKQKIYHDLIDKVTYIFIDPITQKKRTIKKILKRLSGKELISYHHDDMVYIYADDLIFGIDLSLTDFVGLQNEKIIRKIKQKSKIFLTKSNIFIEYKNILENLDYQVKYIPYLYSIENG